MGSRKKTLRRSTDKRPGPDGGGGGPALPATLATRHSRALLGGGLDRPVRGGGARGGMC